VTSLPPPLRACSAGCTGAWCISPHPSTHNMRSHADDPPHTPPPPPHTHTTAAAPHHHHALPPPPPPRSKAVGFRFGPHMGTAVPLMIDFAGKAGEGDDELREHCLQALESFVARSPAACRPLLPQVLAAALGYLKYDPNYADDMEEDEEGDDDDEEQEEDE
jgi:hypothetical protein